MCIMAKTVSACVYDDEKCLEPTSMYPSYRTDGRSSGERPADLDPVEIPIAAASHPPSDVPPPAELYPIPSASDATWIVTDELAAQQVFGVDRVPHGELVLARRNLFEQRVLPYTSRSTFTAPSFPLSIIPPELWMPLLNLGEEKLQVQISDTAATELDMRSCVLGCQSINHKLTLRN
jgi:hypothetical protein